MTQNFQNKEENIAIQKALNNYVPPPIKGNFIGKHIISINQFEKKDLQIIFDMVEKIENMFSKSINVKKINKIMATMFFESSTRTDLSFQSAMCQLGGNVILPSNGVHFSSVYKGEDLADTLRAVACYANVIVLRHPHHGATYYAAQCVDNLKKNENIYATIISAGDGIGEHPSQALLDFYTMVKLKGNVKTLSLNNTTLTLVGDLKNGRTVHSLSTLLSLIKPKNFTLNLIAPDSLSLPDIFIQKLLDIKIKINKHNKLGTILKTSDIIYWTRIQKERFKNLKEYDKLKFDFVMTNEKMNTLKKDAIFLHPLPRHIDMGSLNDKWETDQNLRAKYFTQMKNGVLVRKALLALVLGIKT